jgi:tyrosyl-tRNA synthetase
LRVANALAKAGLVASNGEGKRAIAQKAASVNDVLVTDETAALSAADLVDGAIKLSLGKKRHALLKVS